MPGTDIREAINKIMTENNNKPMLLSEFGVLLRKAKGIDVSGVRISELVTDSEEYECCRPDPSSAIWIRQIGQEIPPFAKGLPNVRYALLLALAREIKEGQYRCYSIKPPFGFTDLPIEEEMPESCIEITRDSIWHMDSVQDRDVHIGDINRLSAEQKRKLYAHAISWGKRYELPHEAIFCETEKETTMMMRSMLDVLVQTLSKDELKRVLIPMDVAVKLARIKA